MRTIAFVATLIAAPAAAQQSPPETLAEPRAAEVRINGAVVEPRSIEPNASSVAQLRLPQGFDVQIFARDLGNARMIAVADDGTVYVTRRAEGDVVMLRDADGDGSADDRRTVARRPGMHGIAIAEGRMYLVAGKEVLSTTIQNDGTLGELQVLAADLPDTGQHSARSVAVGPDGMLYLGVGSTCNACAESNPESAALLRMSPDGKSRTIFASGLRHTIGVDWHPRTGQMWGMDHGIDWLGDEQQLEELNRIELGKNYGWPYIYGFGDENPQDDPPNGLTMAELKAAATEPVLGYTAHAAPMQFKFYRGAMFPEEYQGGAFVTFRGSWNRSDPSGFELARVRFDEEGNATGFEPFLHGFLQQGPDGPTQSGRPVGLAVAEDGALLFSDDINGVIYRVSYEGDDAAGAVMAAPPPRPPESAPRPEGEALAMDRAETAAEGRISITSPAFAANGRIPLEASAYGSDTSPAIAWSELPDDATHLAILMEDPDAKSVTPFVHWVAWNIPAAGGKLPAALPKELQLNDPKGMRQGRNTRGSIGYFGPRPPIGDPPHHYHFQIFALSGPLDLKVGASREDLLSAMANRVIAKGDLVGTYAQPEPPRKR